jgi:hypothetical protein
MEKGEGSPQCHVTFFPIDSSIFWHFMLLPKANLQKKLSLVWFLMSVTSHQGAKKCHQMSHGGGRRRVSKNRKKNVACYLSKKFLWYCIKVSNVGFFRNKIIAAEEWNRKKTGSSRKVVWSKINTPFHLKNVITSDLIFISSHIFLSKNWSYHRICVQRQASAWRTSFLMHYKPIKLNQL